MHAAPRSLERISLIVPEHALEPWEAALRATCDSVSFFRDHTAETWHLEGIRSAEAPNAPLTAAVALAETLTGISPCYPSGTHQPRRLDRAQLCQIS